jgi:hypothetical protein
VCECNVVVAQALLNWPFTDILLHLHKTRACAGHSSPDLTGIFSWGLVFWVNFFFLALPLCDKHSQGPVPDWTPVRYRTGDIGRYPSPAGQYPSPAGPSHVMIRCLLMSRL